MKATIERATLLKSLGHVQSVVERRNTIPILSNVLIEAREDGSIRLMATDLDLQVDESVPANVDPGRRDHRLRAHLVRHRPQAARGQPGRADRRRRQDAGHRRPLALQPVDAAARRFPGDRRGRAADPLRAARGDASPDHRQDPLRHLERGDALLSDGHLPPRRRRPAARRRDRRPPAGAGHRRQARRRRRHAGRDRPAQMRRRALPPARGARGHGRNLAVADQDPLRPRQRGPDQQADRRHLPRLQPGHPDRQRQAAEARSEELLGRASTASRPSPARRPARSR